MSPETLFQLSSVAVMPAWLMLALLPHHEITRKLVHAVWIPCLLGALYCWALFFGPPAAEGAGFGSLQGVMLLFQSEVAVLAGWVHYLVFDLFVGAWIVRDARSLGINHWLTLPCLFGTFMVGPAGLLLYCLMRLGIKRSYSFC